MKFKTKTDRNFFFVYVFFLIVALEGISYIEKITDKATRIVAMSLVTPVVAYLMVVEIPRLLRKIFPD